MRFQLENEIFVLDDININILQNGVNLLEKKRKHF